MGKISKTSGAESRELTVDSGGSPDEARELVRQLRELSEELAELRLVVDGWQHQTPDYAREWTAA